MMSPGLRLFQGSSRTARLLTGALALLSAPVASAGVLADRLEFSMYGRVGVAWTPSGELIHGRNFNLTGSAIGGRLEEGDYLEPTVKLHLLKPAESKAEGQVEGQVEGPSTAPYAHFVLTPALFARNGLFIGTFSNRFSETLGIELFQAYVEAGNVLAPGLKLWGGARFYRGADVHIADYFFFNNLTGQGVGVQYGPLDMAVLLQTSGNGSQYNFDADGDGALDVRRQRTVLVSQYVHPLQNGHSAHFLAELHALPSVEARLSNGDTAKLGSDFGWVAGAKGHLDLGNGSFNDLSVRYGSRIAGGSRAGAQTWDTYGLPGANGKYTDAMGVELVEHLLYNVNPRLSINSYGILHLGQGGSKAASDKFLDFAVGTRSTVYVSDQFHLINEASFQGLREGDGPMGTAAKFTLMPTIVPSGERSVWARPHLRFIYTVARYNKQAVDTLSSPFLQTVGPKSIGHYLGARVEWWL